MAAAKYYWVEQYHHLELRLQQWMKKGNGKSYFAMQFCVKLSQKSPNSSQIE
jgi:hypothetical protein